MTSSVESAEFSVVPHTMNRIDISAGVEFDEFRAAFEKAAAAPTTRCRYGRSPIGVAVQLLSVAGHTTRAVEYLLGNHTIAETMFRHDPKALLYAPLRVLICADADGNAIFSMDQPSAALGSLGIAEVTKVGEGLARKVANLLRVIGIDADQAFGPDRKME